MYCCPLLPPKALCTCIRDLATSRGEQSTVATTPAPAPERDLASQSTDLRRSSVAVEVVGGVPPRSGRAAEIVARVRSMVSVCVRARERETMCECVCVCVCVCVCERERERERERESGLARSTVWAE